MDDLFQAIAILILIAAGGGAELFKRLRESTKETHTPKPPKPAPAKPRQTGQQQTEPQSEWYDSGEFMDRENEDPMTTIFKELFDHEDPVIVDEPPYPPKEGQWRERPGERNIFEQWGQPEEVPPFRPEAYGPKYDDPIPAPPPKPKVRPVAEIPPPKKAQKTMGASELLAGATAYSSKSTFQSLYDRYGDNPLKLAVIYNEILGKPRSMRNTSFRKYT